MRLRGGQLTYVTLFNDHGIRMFNQLDSNYVSKESVKKVQLFLYAVTFILFRLLIRSFIIKFNWKDQLIELELIKSNKMILISFRRY